MTDYVKAWQCIGCGRIDAPQNCVGICEDRKVEFVYAGEHRSLQADAERMAQRIEALERVVRRLARTTPRTGAHEASWHALQRAARQVLAGGTGDDRNGAA
ncbi:MAG: hypothetical protein IPM22_03000 [Betaproteobacteria bacterium]|nr:hypothetical protein [Betaproteobacteria bacterium]